VTRGNWLKAFFYRYWLLVFLFGAAAFALACAIITGTPNAD
jgi:hypothetical protein